MSGMQNNNKKLFINCNKNSNNAPFLFDNQGR